MAPNSSDAAPIYDSLVDEHGDVLAEARRAAEEAQRTTNRTLYVKGPAPEQHTQPAAPATVRTGPSQPPAQPPPHQPVQPAPHHPVQPEYEHPAPQGELPGAWPYEPHARSGWTS